MTMRESFFSEMHHIFSEMHLVFSEMHRIFSQMHRISLPWLSTCCVRPRLGYNIDVNSRLTLTECTQNRVFCLLRLTRGLDVPEIRFTMNHHFVAVEMLPADECCSC